ncbi:MAG: hypothetical protein VZQ98_18005, partial [Bacteroidales bacterium]|nr:hypothetical protein [Bacteroidales bacterium]
LGMLFIFLLSAAFSGDAKRICVCKFSDAMQNIGAVLRHQCSVERNTIRYFFQTFASLFLMIRFYHKNFC